MAEIKEKLCSLSEAAKLIKDGTRITIGGFSMHGHPMAFVYELIRQGIKDLTIVGHVGSTDIDALVGAGCVKRLEIAYVGLEEFGLAPNFRRAVENGEIELAEYSEPVSFQRFVCSASGWPFIPVYELLGTDLPKVNPDIKEMINPFDGRKCHAVSGADPDWVVVHAPLGDKYGNVLYLRDIQQPQELDLVSVRTTRNVIVTVEKIIDSELVVQLSHLNKIPRFKTTAIVEVPYGAHPTSCIGIYEYDSEHLRMYSQMAKDPSDFKKYLDKYVYGIKSQLDYLKLVGVESLINTRFIGANLS